MKKIIWLVTLALPVVHGFCAQKIQAHYISVAGDTIPITIRVKVLLMYQRPDYEMLQHKIRYYDVNNKKHSLRPAQAREVFFTYEGEKIRMLSVPDIFNLYPYDSSLMFLRIIIDGPLKLYNYYETHVSHPMPMPGGVMAGGGTSHDSQFVLQKNNGDFFTLGLFSFRKPMKEYLADCPAVVQKIDEKEYRRWDMEQIVNEYNSTCGK